MNPVNCFEIPARDLGRAKSFYEKVFDVELKAMEMGSSKMAMFPGGPGAENASGCLMKGEGYEPSHSGSVVYFHVKNIDQTLNKIKAAGGSTLMPNTSIGENGFMAQFQDSEGNRVALHSMG
jgi:uncharacterized protein